MRDTVGFQGGVAWTPSDTAVIPRQTRGFYVAEPGNVALGYPDGSSVVWPACVAGLPHAHFGFDKVLSTGTTATGIVIGY
jgi:hypothetical protein